jgi:hypothetical protein
LVSGRHSNGASTHHDDHSTDNHHRFSSGGRPWRIRVASAYGVATREDSRGLASTSDQNARQNATVGADQGPADSARVSAYTVGGLGMTLGERFADTNRLEYDFRMRSFTQMLGTR